MDCRAWDIVGCCDIKLIRCVAWMLRSIQSMGWLHTPKFVFYFILCPPQAPRQASHWPDGAHISCVYVAWKEEERMAMYMLRNPVILNKTAGIISRLMQFRCVIPSLRRYILIYVSEARVAGKDDGSRFHSWLSLCMTSREGGILRVGEDNFASHDTREMGHFEYACASVETSVYVSPLRLPRSGHDDTAEKACVMAART